MNNINCPFCNQIMTCMFDAPFDEDYNCYNCYYIIFVLNNQIIKDRKIFYMDHKIYRIERTFNCTEIWDMSNLNSLIINSVIKLTENALKNILVLQ